MWRRLVAPELSELQLLLFCKSRSVSRGAGCCFSLIGGSALRGDSSVAKRSGVQARQGFLAVPDCWLSCTPTLPASVPSPWKGQLLLPPTPSTRAQRPQGQPLGLQSCSAASRPRGGHRSGAQVPLLPLDGPCTCCSLCCGPQAQGSAWHTVVLWQHRPWEQTGTGPLLAGHRAGSGPGRALTTALAGTQGAATVAGASSPGGPGHPDHCSWAGTSAWGADSPCWGLESGPGVQCHRMTVRHTKEAGGWGCAERASGSPLLLRGLSPSQQGTSGEAAAGMRTVFLLALVQGSTLETIPFQEPRSPSKEKEPGAPVSTEGNPRLRPAGRCTGEEKLARLPPSRVGSLRRRPPLPSCPPVPSFPPSGCLSQPRSLGTGPSYLEAVPPGTIQAGARGGCGVTQACGQARQK